MRKYFEKKLFLFFLLFLSIEFAFAQSEKVDEIANSSIPCLHTIEKDSTENKTNLVDFPNYKYIVAENVADFIKQLNELGKCGYRLDNLTKVPLKSGKSFGELNLAAIVKLDIPNKYEYDWFEAFTPGEVKHLSKSFSVFSPTVKQTVSLLKQTNSLFYAIFKMSFYFC